MKPVCCRSQPESTLIDISEHTTLMSVRLGARLRISLFSPKGRWLRMTVPELGEGGSPFKPGRVRGTSRHLHGASPSPNLASPTRPPGPRAHRGS